MQAKSMRAQLSSDPVWNDAMNDYCRTYLAARAIDKSPTNNEEDLRIYDAERSAQCVMEAIPSPDLDCLLWKLKHASELADLMEGAPDAWMEALAEDVRHMVSRITKVVSEHEGVFEQPNIGWIDVSEAAAQIAADNGISSDTWAAWREMKPNGTADRLMAYDTEREVELICEWETAAAVE